MPTPLSEVVKSPVAVHVLTGVGVTSAEQLATWPDTALLGLKNVGNAALRQIRTWQLSQEPPIPIPQEAIGPEEVQRLRRSDENGRGAVQQRPIAPEVTRETRILRLARAFYREWVTIDRERNMPPDLRALREEAYEAAAAFYPPAESGKET
jgi:hypothetical protein